MEKTLKAQKVKTVNSAVTIETQGQKDNENRVQDYVQSNKRKRIKKRKNSATREVREDGADKRVKLDSTKSKKQQNRKRRKKKHNKPVTM